MFFQKCNFLERRAIKMLSRDVYMTFFVYAEHPPLINPLVLLILDWSFYNSKSSKLNGSASLFGRKNRKTFSYFWALVRATHSAIAIARPRACRSPYRNRPPANKDELAGAASRAYTNNSSTPSYTPAISRIPTPTLAPPLASVKLVGKYTNADL